MFSAGYTTVTNNGREPAVVERVRILGLTGPIEFLGVRTRKIPNDGDLFLGENDFPPPAYPAKPLTHTSVGTCAL